MISYVAGPLMTFEDTECEGFELIRVRPDVMPDPP